MAQEQQKPPSPPTREGHPQKGMEKAEPQHPAMERPRKHELASPYSAMKRLMDEMDRFFGSPFGASPLATFFGGLPSVEAARPVMWLPAIETLEQGGRLLFRADLPGLARGDIKVEIADDDLVISGERKQEEQQSRRGAMYSERRYGSFERRFSLPQGTDPSTIEARFDNGVLEVSLALPKAVPTRRNIEIGSGPSKEKAGPSSVH
jgi:HSP20 family protein